MCDFCRNFDFGTAKASTDKFGATIHLAGGSYRFPLHEQFNFCPNCGASKDEIQREQNRHTEDDPFNT